MNGCLTIVHCGRSNFLSLSRVETYALTSHAHPGQAAHSESSGASCCTSRWAWLATGWGSSCHCFLKIQQQEPRQLAFHGKQCYWKEQARDRWYRHCLYPFPKCFLQPASVDSPGLSQSQAICSNSDSYLLRRGPLGDMSESVNMTIMTFLEAATRLTVQMITPQIVLGISNREIKL